MTELSPQRRNALLAYCRIDELEPADEELLVGMYYSALGYMEAAGVSEPAEGTARRAQFDLCVNYLVLDAWDRRGAAGDKVFVENPAFRRLLNQMKRTEPLGGSHVR